MSTQIIVQDSLEWCVRNSNATARANGSVTLNSSPSSCSAPPFVGAGGCRVQLPRTGNYSALAYPRVEIRNNQACLIAQCEIRVSGATSYAYVEKGEAWVENSLPRLWDMDFATDLQNGGCLLALRLNCYERRDNHTSVDPELMPAHALCEGFSHDLTPQTIWGLSISFSLDPHNPENLVLLVDNPYDETFVTVDHQLVREDFSVANGHAEYIGWRQNPQGPLIKTIKLTISPLADDIYLVREMAAVASAIEP